MGEYHGHVHYCDVITGTMASQNTGLAIVYSIVHSGANQRKLQSSASLAFVRGIHRWPVNSPHKWPGMRKMLPFDDVIMNRPPANNQYSYHCALYCQAYLVRYNQSLPRQNGRHFADDMFKCIFINEMFCISIQISLKFVPNGPIDNNPALV